MGCDINSTDRCAFSLFDKCTIEKKVIIFSAFKILKCSHSIIIGGTGVDFVSIALANACLIFFIEAMFISSTL